MCEAARTVAALHLCMEKPVGENKKERQFQPVAAGVLIFTNLSRQAKADLVKGVAHQAGLSYGREVELKFRNAP